METMQAVLTESYGPPEVAQLREIPKPVPTAGQILVKVKAAEVSSGDSRMRRGSRDALPLWPLSRLAIGALRPNRSILGFAAAGVVEAAGDGVIGFKPGDEVVCSAGRCHAEYLLLKNTNNVVHKPAGMSWTDAASLPFGGLSALYLLRLGMIKAGQNVLIYGASGAVGTFAVQLAKHFGTTVTAVCSAANMALVRNLGADHVIDYTAEDFTRNGQVYDVIVDIVGKTHYEQVKGSLAADGYFVLSVMDTPDLPRLMLSRWTKQKVVSGVADTKSEHLRLLIDLCQAGVIKPVIDAVYPYTEAVAAHRRVDSGRKRGSVLLSFEPTS
jgi:NADPH:quinone reductase-like Zn-dependent oxidoreductase